MQARSIDRCAALFGRAVFLTAADAEPLAVTQDGRSRFQSMEIALALGDNPWTSWSRTS